MRRALVVVVVVAIGAFVWGLLWYEGQVGGGPLGPAVIVDVRSGSSVSAVTAALAGQKVVSSGLAFQIYLTLHGTPTVQPGRYQLRRRQSFGAVRDRLAAGPNVFAVTVVPGTTVAETLDQVATAVPRFDGPALAAAVASQAHRSPWNASGSNGLDGLLGTGTYIVVPGETGTQLVRQMIDRFDAEATAMDLTTRSAALGLTPYQAVTAASIVQKEAISPGDSAAATAHNAGPVARVIYNRLARGMALQMDSTVLYALGRDGGPVTAADEAIHTPYNTYLNTGLTPTPICFPSATALAAALNPPAGNWIYFELTSRDGTETFSDTLAGQLAAEKLAQSRGIS